MDQGIALVLGAVIALVGSIGAPWIRESFSLRSAERQRAQQAEAQRRDALRGDIIAFLESCSGAMTKPRNTPARREPSIIGTRLTLMAEPEDIAIGVVTTNVAGEIARGGSNISVYLAAAATVLPQWYHGLRTADETLAAWVRLVRSEGLEVGDNGQVNFAGPRDEPSSDA